MLVAHVCVPSAVTRLPKHDSRVRTMSYDVALCEVNMWPIAVLLGILHTVSKVAWECNHGN